MPYLRLHQAVSGNEEYLDDDTGVNELQLKHEMHRYVQAELKVLENSQELQRAFRAFFMAMGVTNFCSPDTLVTMCAYMTWHKYTFLELLNRPSTLQEFHEQLEEILGQAIGRPGTGEDTPHTTTPPQIAEALYAHLSELVQYELDAEPSAEEQEPDIEATKDVQRLRSDVYRYLYGILSTAKQRSLRRPLRDHPGVAQQLPITFPEKLTDCYDAFVGLMKEAGYDTVYLVNPKAEVIEEDDVMNVDAGRDGKFEHHERLPMPYAAASLVINEYLMMAAEDGAFLPHKTGYRTHLAPDVDSAASMYLCFAIRILSMHGSKLDHDFEYRLLYLAQYAHQCDTLEGIDWEDYKKGMQDGRVSLRNLVQRLTRGAESTEETIQAYCVLFYLMEWIMRSKLDLTNLQAKDFAAFPLAKELELNTVFESISDSNRAQYQNYTEQLGKCQESGSWNGRPMRLFIGRRVSTMLATADNDVIIDRRKITLGMFEERMQCRDELAQRLYEAERRAWAPEPCNPEEIWIVGNGCIFPRKTRLKDQEVQNEVRGFLGIAA